jgi:hypothetical protein
MNPESMEHQPEELRQDREIDEEGKETTQCLEEKQTYP